jgi:hypothetical protein
MNLRRLQEKKEINEIKKTTQNKKEEFNKHMENFGKKKQNSWK